MGAHFGRSLATIYVSEIENAVFNNDNMKLPQFYTRFIDDSFGLFDGTIKELQTFFIEINNQDKNINFTYNTSYTDIQFLDLQIFKTESHNNTITLSTAPFLKPTSTMKLIHPDSAHTKHTKRGTIHAQLLRMLKSSTFFEHFNTAKCILFQALREQGYSRSYLRNIKNEILKNLGLNSDDRKVNLGFSPCNRCTICKYAATQSSIHHNNKIKIITSRMNCDTENVVYMIRCKKCNKYYTGETQHPLKKRIQKHISTIRNKYNLEIPNHFNKEDHNFETDFEFFGIHNKNKWSEIERKKKEAEIINTFKTGEPNGLNISQPKFRNRYHSIPYLPREMVPETLQSITSQFKLSHSVQKNTKRLFHSMKYTDN